MKPFIVDYFQALFWELKYKRQFQQKFDMKTVEIKRMQAKIDAAGFPLVIDGAWGEKSIAACKAYLTSLMPPNRPWPTPDQASLRAFYGAPGDESQLVSIEFPFPTYYDGKLVKSTRVHRKCADSLLRVLKSIGREFGNNRGVMEEAEDYSGCFNFRNKRGSDSISVHAYGAAIDYDADDNTFRDHWPMQADMPLEIMEAFAREGWKSAGAFWGYDAMHFQATL